jgi:DNA (cytosine-5)-methyltransferase 1
MNAMEYANVPQNRERIFIVCFDPKQVPNHKDFQFPEKEDLTRSVKDCIDYKVSDSKYFYTEKFPHYDELRENMTSADTVYQWRRQYVRENKSNVCPTLTANMGTGGHNVPLVVTKDGIRKLTPKECINFQGYPKEYSFPASIAESAKYKQAGNSIVVPVLEGLFRQLMEDDNE